MRFLCSVHWYCTASVTFPIPWYSVMVLMIAAFSSNILWIFAGFGGGPGPGPGRWWWMTPGCPGGGGPW